MLATKDQNTSSALQEALLHSGYLTNAVITITNLPLASVGDKAIYREIQRRLTTHLGRIEFWEYYMRSNQAIIMCRSIDLPRVRQAIESP